MGKNIEKFKTLMMKKLTLLPIQHMISGFSSGNKLVGIICFVVTGIKELFVYNVIGVDHRRFTRFDLGGFLMHEQY